MYVNEYPILIDQLCPGLYIRLEEPDKLGLFAKKAFKIKTQSQIDDIKKLGLTHVICVSDKSDSLPIPLEELERNVRDQAADPAGKKTKTPVSLELLGLKRETIERNKERRQRFANCEKRYEKAVGEVIGVLKKATKPTDQVLDAAEQVVDTLVNTFLSDMDVVVNLITSKPKEETRNYHAMNVTVMAMMLANTQGLDKKAMRDLGMGALFHDVGKGRVPIQRFSKDNITTMNKVIREYYMEHPRIGARIVAGFPHFPADSLKIILQHHESLDGQGFPNRLKGDELSMLVRIVAVADAYDKLCNRKDAAGYLTPHEALKAMYNRRGKLDGNLISLFIKQIGVYPPGSIVELSNGLVGMVVSTNPQNSFRPSVMVYHPEVPKKEALVIDLTIEDELKVVRHIRPEELAREAHAYLSPVRQVNYYVDNLQKT